MDRPELWNRRSGNTKLSLTTNDKSNENKDSRDQSSRAFPTSKSSHGGKNPFSSPSISSPAGGASFGLGTGAFASFGSKTPKTPGTAFDWSRTAAKTSAEKPKTSTPVKESSKEDVTSTSEQSSPSKPDEHPLQYTWIVYFRPPASKNVDYEASIQPMCRMRTVENFWAVYQHLKRPSMLPHISDYHFFREGIRPVWEDEANKKGGKWILRLKKGVADRYWENLLLAMIGNQFMEAHDEVCGAVVSVRAQEDVISIWTKNDGGRNIKIRETVKRVLELPPDTIITWKSHDDSISQRTAIDQARTETKRRATMTSEDAS